MYSIYHIPTFVHKDGSIGKIGCTTKPAPRVKEQGYTDYEILETIKDIYIASDREIEFKRSMVILLIKFLIGKFTNKENKLVV